MPKTSKTTADHEVMGPAETWIKVLDGYEAATVLVHEDGDLAPLLKGLPDDRCPCPHWGHVFSGSLTFTYADGTVEIFEAGDAFYTPPGHTPACTAGTEFLLFSPADLAAEVNAAIQRNAAAMGGAG